MHMQVVRGDASEVRSKQDVQIADSVRAHFLEQARAMTALAERIDENLLRAIDLLLNVKGRVVVTGIGKSGIIGRKIAATLASTGTPSFFVHTGEAFHGDLGMITEDDAVILVSNSGETEELVRLMPYLQARAIPTVAIVGRPDSALAKSADVSLDAGVDRETCPNNLAPTTSTLAALAMGDAVAVALVRVRGFRAEDFARLHPGGEVGRIARSRARARGARG